jgi:glycerol kinase
VIETMVSDSGIELNELRVDGGAAVNNLLMQIQSDAIGRNVVRPKITETTALGAAYFAGLAVGFWKSIEEIKDQWQVDQKFIPKAKESEIKNTITNWKRAVERCKNWHNTESI